MSNLLVPIVLLISSIGLFFTYLSPGYETLKAFQNQEQRVDDALEKFEQVIIKKEELTDQYVRFGQRELDGLKLVVPNEVDVVQVVLILDKLAQENKIYVESFEVPDLTQKTVSRKSSDEQPQEYGTATFRLSIVGTYENIKNLLYQAERSQVLLDVVELTVEPVEAEGVQGTYTFSMALNTYWLF